MGEDQFRLLDRFTEVLIEQRESPAIQSQPVELSRDEVRYLHRLLRLELVRSAVMGDVLS
jgi:hypothetical protein